MKMEVKNSLNISLKHFNSICRVCLTQSELLIPIHEIIFTYNLNSNSSVKTISLTSLFLNYCKVTVHEGDGKPQKVCEICMEALCEAYNVFELFLESNDLFDTLISKRKVEKETSVSDSILQISLCDIKIDITKNNENNSGDSAGYTDPVNKKNIGCDGAIVVMPKNDNSKDNKNALDVTFDSDFLAVDNIDPSDDPNPNHKVFNKSDKNMEDGAIKTEHEYCKSRPKSLPFYVVDPKSMLRDHTYSVSERTFLRRCRALCGRHLRNKKPRPKKPKAVKILPISEFKRKQLQRKQERENTIYNCRFCEIKFQGMEKVLEHLKGKHTDTKECILCPKSCDRHDFIMSHMKSHVQYGFICTGCNLYFKSRKSLELHNESPEHKGPFPCRICDKTFVSRATLRSHMKAVHVKDAKPKQQCSVCGILFKWAQNLNRHMRKHQETQDTKKKFQCDECGIMMRWKHSLEEHILRHRDVSVRKTFLCQFCAKSFVSNNSLNFHLGKVHEGQTHRSKPKPPSTTKFQCEVCSDIFKTKHSFFQHRLTHPDVRVLCPYCHQVLENPKKYREHRFLNHRSSVCDVCKKTFPDNYQLTRHKNVYHLKTYRCTDCDATFGNPFTYKYHRLLHTETEPYKCKFCGKTFKRDYYRARHIQCVHTGKKFQCKICGKKFLFNSSLKDHMRSHTGEKPFICPYCAKPFRDTIGRHKHVKHYHPDKLEEFLIYKRDNQEKEVKIAEFSGKTIDFPGVTRPETEIDDKNPIQAQKVTVVQNNLFKNSTITEV